VSSNFAIFHSAEQHCFIQNQSYWFDNAIIVQNLIRQDNHRAQNQSGFHKCAGCFLAMEKQPAQQPKNLSSAAEQVDSDAISRRVGRHS
jgi:hypothetical protein